MSTPPRPTRPRSPSPAERSEELAAVQRQLKEEASNRRKLAEAAPDGPRRPQPTGSRRNAGG